MAFQVFLELRLNPFAEIGRVRTTWVEPAGLRRIYGAWYLAWQYYSCGLSFDIWNRNSGDWSLSIGMKSLGEQIVCVCLLDNLSEIHHGSWSSRSWNLCPGEL